MSSAKYLGRFEFISKEVAGYKKKIFQETSFENRMYLTLFLVTCLGGAVRKWVITSSVVGNAVLMAQMIIPFLMLVFRSGRSFSPISQYKIIGLYFFYLIVQIFNPLQHTLFHGILGVLVHGGMWLAFYFYLCNRHLFNPIVYMPVIMAIAFGEIVLGFIQYQLPGDHLLNRYAMDVIKDVAVVGDRVRVTGSFSYLAGFNAFLLFFTFFIWGMMRMRMNSWIISIAAVFGLIASFMSGSRGGTFIYLLIVVPAFMREYSASEFASFAWKLVLPAAIGFTMLLVAKKTNITDQIFKAYENFAGRVERGSQSGEQSQRIFWDLHYLTNRKFEFPIFGVGTGATYQGATLLFGKSPEASAFGYVENEPIKNLLEGGIVLILLRIILSTILVANLTITGWPRYILWLLMVYMLPVVFNPHNAAFFFMGLALLDNIIWRQGLVAEKEKSLLISANRQINPA
jgi:hypothetical protein